MMLGSVVLPIGLFWFAWTSFPSINPWPEIASGFGIGIGVMLISMQAMNYVVRQMRLMLTVIISTDKLTFL